jgi:hypothetical protein
MAAAHQQHSQQLEEALYRTAQSARHHAPFSEHDCAVKKHGVVFREIVHMKATNDI